MDLKEYQKLAQRTLSGNFFVNNPMPPLLHAAMGVTTEAGELLDAFCVTEFDKTNVREEIGDLLWYAAIYFEYGEGSVSDFKETSDLYSYIRIANIHHAKEFAESIVINATKFLDIFKKAIFYNRPLDYTNLDAFLEQILSELNSLAMWAGSSLEIIAEANIKKLQARYPEKFDEEKADKRDLKKEREVLENA